MLNCREPRKLHFVLNRQKHGHHEKFLIIILSNYYSNDLLFAIYNACPQRKFIISHRSGHQYWYRIYLVLDYGITPAMWLFCLTI